MGEGASRVYAASQFLRQRAKRCKRKGSRRSLASWQLARSRLQFARNQRTKIVYFLVGMGEYASCFCDAVRYANSRLSK